MCLCVCSSLCTLICLLYGMTCNTKIKDAEYGFVNVQWKKIENQFQERIMKIYPYGPLHKGIFCELTWTIF